MRNQLLKNASWIFIGNLVFSFCQWLQLSLIAKTSSIWIIGTYTLAIAISTTIFMFCNYQLRAIQFTDTEKNWELSDFITFRLISNIIAISILSCISLFINSEYSNNILILIGVLKSIDGFSEILNTKQQLNNQAHVMSLSLTQKGVSQTLGLYFGLSFFKSLEIGLCIAIIGNLFILIFYDLKKTNIKLSLTQYNSKIKLKEILIQGFPLALVMLIITLNSNMSKYIAEIFLGRESQGVYSTIAYFLIPGTLLVSATAQTFLPKLNNFYINKDLISFKKLSQKLSILCLSIGVIASIITFFFGKIILQLTFNTEIAQHSNLLFLIMVASIFLYLSSAYGYTLTSMREFKIQPLINSITLVVSCISAIILAKTNGINGLAYATIITFMTQALITRVIIKLKIKKT